MQQNHSNSIGSLYQKFIESKTQLPDGSGFEPIWMPDQLYDFQQHLTGWAIRRGRSAIFAECGMGKTPMQLVYAENIVRKTNGRVLILTPLAVTHQTVSEGEKFGVDCIRSRDGSFASKSKIIVTNYERLKHFQSTDFDGVVADESSILKNFDGSTKAEVTEFMRRIPYRLLCTATAAPNDYHELGTSSEALGELGYQDMLTKFFRKQQSSSHRGWSRLKYHIRGHAQKEFWRWVCSWARAIRKPSDYGFDDGEFVLPKLVTNEHLVKCRTNQPGRLFDVPAESLEEQRKEQRRSLPERCEKVAELISQQKGQSVAWCFLNDEGDMIEELTPDCVQVSGSDSDDKKEEILTGFAKGQIKRIVTKPEIAGFGLNWQKCNHQTYFPSHSFEQYYQGVRRCWRFGQKKTVTVDLITTDGNGKVMENLARKSAQAEEMFAQLVLLMTDSLKINRSSYGTKQTELPSWL